VSASLFVSKAQFEMRVSLYCLSFKVGTPIVFLRNLYPTHLCIATRFVVEKFGEDSPMFILPSDQHIADSEAFASAVKTGFAWLSEHPDEIGTIGITPTRPETGYGYINSVKPLAGKVKRVEEFVEKPDEKTAQKYLDAGSYLWNGGMFLFTAHTMQQQFRTLQPSIFDAVQDIKSIDDIKKSEYEKSPSISFDYAIMETTTHSIFTVETSCGWSDVGSWFSYWELLPKDENGNAAKGKATFVDSSGCMVYNATEKPVLVFNKSGELIVSLPDCTLAASLNDHQHIKKITQMLGQLNLDTLR